MLYFVELEVQRLQIRNAVRQSIIRLLLSTLEKPTPNLAQFLLGFDPRKPISQTSLQDPGIPLFYFNYWSCYKSPFYYLFRAHENDFPCHFTSH